MKRILIEHFQSLDNYGTGMMGLVTVQALADRYGTAEVEFIAILPMLRHSRLSGASYGAMSGCTAMNRPITIRLRSRISGEGVCTACSIFSFRRRGEASTG